MKIGELEVNFEPFELPEDYKFVYKIKGCEHKIDFDTNTIVDKILSTRTKMVDEEVIRQLRNIGEEKGINELILIDESKVLKIVKSIKALEIIKTLKDVDFIINYDEEHDCWVLLAECEYDQLIIASGFGKDKYELLKEVLL